MAATESPVIEAPAATQPFLANAEVVVVRMKLAHFASLHFIALLLGMCLPGRASGAICEHPEVSTTPVVIAAADTVQMLIIYARFPDGMDVAPNGYPNNECTECGPGYGWPVGLTSPPAWADSLIENTTNPVIPGSITHFFHTWSKGKHVVKGTSYPSVVVVDSTLTYFDQTYGPDESQASQIEEVLAANRRVLQLVDADMSVDFSAIDYVVVFWRQTRTIDENDVYRVVYGGVSWLIPVGTTLVLDGKTYTHEHGATITSPTTFDEIYVIRHRWEVLALLVHEYGHDVTDAAGYGAAHFRTVSRYGIMQGNIIPASLMMEGFLRYKLGWISPLEVNPGGSAYQTTLKLSARYQDGDANFAILRTRENDPGSAQYFLLEARREDASGEDYNTAQPTGYPNCTVRTTPVGDGLLITHVTEDGLTQPDATEVPLLDIEVASGMFNLSSNAPDPVKGFDFINPNEFGQGGWTGQPSDLFEDSSAGDRTNTFTPFTNPSTDLYRDDVTSSQAWQDRYSGISIYNVRWNAGHDSIEVSIRYDGWSIPAKADTLRVDMKWEGLTQVMGDVDVPPGRTLEIGPGSRVVFAADKDKRGGGLDATNGELIIRGRLAGNGSGSPLLWTTSRDPNFVHFGLNDLNTPGETTSPSAGDWFGVRFRLQACERSGYGYAVANGPPSSLTNGTLKYGQVGAAIEGTCAPVLESMTFESITNDRHVYLDSTDVYLPRGYYATGSCASPGTINFDPMQWTLLAGTRVVAANATLTDSWMGESGKVDLVLNRKITTTTASNDSVKFRPETEHNATAADWGGLTLDVGSEGSRLEKVSIGHAPIPLTFLYPGDGTTLEDSRVHHFSDIGVWVYDTGAGGTILESNTIERGSGVDDEIGLTALRCDKGDNLRLRSNKFDLTGLNFGTLTTPAVDLYFGQSFCGYTYSDSDSLVVDSNWILGPSQLDGGNHSGIKTTWVCGASNRKIYFANNYITGFKADGVELHQSSDLQFSCNTIFGNTRAVNHFRDAYPAGTSARFLKNWLDVKAGTEEVVQTDDNLKLNLGAGTNANVGTNGLMAEIDNVDFIQENDTDPSDVVKVENSWWYLYNSISQTESQVLLGNEDAIEDRLVPSAATIDYAPYKNQVPGSGNPIEYCRLTSPPTSGIAHAGPLHASDESDSHSPRLSMENLQESGNDIPHTSFLSVPSLANSEPVTRFEFGVSVLEGGAARLEVFDVAGRRVSTVESRELAPGRYKVDWERRDTSGRLIRPGVYFVRLLLGAKSFTQKLIVRE